MLRRLKQLSLSTIGAAILMAFGGACISTITNVPLVPWKPLLGIVLVVSGLLVGVWKEPRFGEFKTWSLRKNEAQQRPVLILFLSPAPSEPKFLELSNDLDEDLGRLAQHKREESMTGHKQSFWPWEQTLRGIRHNLGVLKRIVLIGSPQTITLSQDFYAKVIQRYPVLHQIRVDVYLGKEKKLKHLVPDSVATAGLQGVDFENFDELIEALQQILTELSESSSLEAIQENVQIDITGGLKSNSAVAGAVTLTSRMSNQYVATNPKDSTAPVWEYEVWGYDAFQRD
ncbi:MAG: hypothetical protein R3C18_04575 [Planctomycetaceae bacterium]